MPDFNYSSAGFKTAPVVVATLVNYGGVSGTDAGNSATLVLTSVGTTQALGDIRFSQSGGINIGVNFIAIGIPN
jgi:hypothetical protein